MLRFKADVNQMLREVGVTFYTSRTSKALSQSTLTAIKNGVVPVRSLEAICDILKCQPGDIIEWIPDESAAENK